MPETSASCQDVQELLPQSLDDSLSEELEHRIADHLSDCDVCRRALETLAGDATRWQSVSQILRKETSSDRDAISPTKSMLLPGPGYCDEDDEAGHGGVRPEDFIVDFLQPSPTRESLGRLGDIEVRQFIGQGAHGIVLKGFQEELHRLVAVKVMAPHLASVVAARKRFAREARATAAIVHPNVMPILHVDSTGQLPFLVMPYVDCESLQDRLDRDSQLPLADVLRIGIQVAHGLAAAHAQGLVHRDVKPANILLERGVERVMLTDFGLARTMDDATLTRSGLIAGTPHYMSPEQARGDAVDARSDLFSLGSVLYTMTAGRPPFRAETTYGILRRVTDDTPRPMTAANPAVPNWFEQVVMTLLHKEPAQRLQSAEQTAELLEDCLAHHEQPHSSPLPQCVKDLVRNAQSQPARGVLTSKWMAVPAVLILTVLALIASPLLRPAASGPEEDSETLPGIATAADAGDSAVEVMEETASITDQWDDGLSFDLEELNYEIEVLSDAVEFDLLQQTEGK